MIMGFDIARVRGTLLIIKMFSRREQSFNLEETLLVLFCLALYFKETISILGNTIIIYASPTTLQSKAFDIVHSVSVCFL
jgi:CII-binding regulator of phage lambda lysogenization HflD